MGFFNMTKDRSARRDAEQTAFTALCWTIGIAFFGWIAWDALPLLLMFLAIGAVGVGILVGVFYLYWFIAYKYYARKNSK